MIQVIERVANILSLLGRESDLSLGEIAERIDVKKTALANILRSLLEIEYVEKGHAAKYRLGRGVIELARTRLREGTLSAVAQVEAESLRESLGETVVISRLIDGYRYIIAYSEAERQITVNSRFERRSSVYDAATGRILIAYAKPEEIQRIIEHHGEPGDSWPEAATIGEIPTAATRIRKKGIVVNRHRETISIAVPVLMENSEIAFAIGVSVPSYRVDTDLQNRIESGLVSAAKRVASILTTMPELSESM
jgi:IclR family transcriptional regulator, acetate operon repressor